MKIKGISVHPSWDAYATLELCERLGIQDMGQAMSIRQMLGIPTVEILPDDSQKEIERKQAEAQKKVTPKTFKAMVHFCHVALETGDPNFKMEFRELFNILFSDQDLMMEIMDVATKQFLKANNISFLDDDPVGKPKAAKEG